MHNKPRNAFSRIVSREVEQSGCSGFGTHEALCLGSFRQRARREAGGFFSDDDQDAIVEIIAADDLIVALSRCGECVVSRRTGLAGELRRVCVLNASPEERIRSVFLNKRENSIVTVSVHTSDALNALKCRSIPLASIQKGRATECRSVFETEALQWPGFIEFDDANGRVLTFSASTSRYKIWDLDGYRPLFSIDEPNLHEVKLSPGFILLVFKRDETSVQLKLLDVRTGQTMRCFFLPLHADRKIDFVEQFHEKLLLKQDGHSLRIFDIVTEHIVRIDQSTFPTPNAFVFLYDKRTFLTFRDGRVAAWGIHGDHITGFDDRLLWDHRDSSPGNIFISNNQSLLLSVSRDDENTQGSVNMSSTQNGKLITHLSAPQQIPETLGDITSLFYDEVRFKHRSALFSLPEIEADLRVTPR